MGRIFDFISGVVVGATLLFVGFKFHVVRASDGFHIVPKISADLSDAYVDIRGFTLADWDKHRPLAVAITKNKEAKLLDESVRRSAENVLQGLTGQPAKNG